MEQLEHTRSRGFSRRTALRTAAWAAPAITVMNAAPAFAASGDDPPEDPPVWSINYNGFRSNLNADYTAGTASASNNNVAVDMGIVVTSGQLADVTVVVTSGAGGNGIAVNKKTVVGNYNGSTWASHAGDLATWVFDHDLAAGNVASDQFSSWTFTKTGPITSDALKICWASIAANDYPFTYTVSSTSGGGSKSLVVNTTASGSFLSGTIS